MTSVNVLLLPETGSGHLMSLIEAGKRLLGRPPHGSGETPPLTVTVLVVQPATAESAAEVDAHVRRVESSGAGVRFHRLPAVDPPTNCIGLQEFKSRYMELQKPHVAAAARELRAAAVVVDFFATTVLDVARELGVPAYIYFTSTAALLALMLRLPALDEEVAVDFKSLEGTVDIPGMPPVPAASIPAFLACKDDPNYTWFVYHGRRFMDFDGVVVNTVAEIEAGVLAAIAEGRCVPGHVPPAVYPIGPVVDLAAAKESGDGQCVRWLDAQPPASVVFLCFGSLGWSDAAKAHEVAAGLERSSHRFLWVLRGPPASAGSPHPTDADLDALLPAGFLDRTRDRGLVWPTWAPQKAVLAHAAVGGFVTHCGWNSTLEALWHGVPLAPWPRYAEQHLNAFELVHAASVAVPMAVDTKRDNFVEATEMERAVRSLMGGDDQGRKARERAQEMKAACRKAVEEGGSSHAALQRLRDAISRGGAAA
jgi:hypothetical protein